MEANKQLEQARIALAQCSYIDNVPQWTVLLNNVISLAIKLTDVNNELAELERKLLLCSLNRFYFFVFI